MDQDNFTGRILKFNANTLKPETVNAVAKHRKAKAIHFEDPTMGQSKRQILFISRES